MPPVTAPIAGLPSDGLLVAEAQRHAEVDRLAARLLGQQRDLHAVRQRETLRARVEIGRGWVEGLARGDRGVALVVLDHRRDVDRRRDRRAVGLRVGHELAEREVRPLEVGERDPLHVGRRHGAVAVALEEEQPPVAQRDRLRERDAERLRTGHGLVEVFGGLLAHARDLGLGDRILRDVGDRRKHRFARRLDRLAVGNLREERQRAWIDAADVPRLDPVAFFVSTSALYRRPDGASVSTSPSTSRRSRPGPRRGPVEHHAEELGVPDAAQRDRALAVLHRLLRVDARQRARRLRDGAEVLRDQRERGLDVELARDDQHRVVGLVVHPVERLQPLDVDVLDVGARADLQVAVVVPLVRGREHLAEQHELRIVLAVLELVAHDRHLGVEVAPADERVHHPVGLHRSAQSRFSVDAVNDSK